MTIACICSTKNEGDIIEAFVRLNAKVCDSFHFVDDSTDNTREIIRLLVKEGYDLSYLQAVRGGHNQPSSTRAYLSVVSRTKRPDWIFLLDADEVVVAPDREALLKEMEDIPPDTYLTAEWRTYVPVSLDYFESSSPLSECFGLRRDLDTAFKKVSIPGGLADSVTTTPGNHVARSLSGTPLAEQPATSYHLAHFPVRSAEQIIVKNLIATHNLTSRPDAEQGEGFHVLPITRMIRDRDYRLTLDDLQHLGLNYARAEQDRQASVRDELDLRQNPYLRTRLSYLGLGRINVVARLDAEVERLSREIKRLRGTSQHSNLDRLRFRVHRG
jgi:hypothetical protein